MKKIQTFLTRTAAISLLLCTFVLLTTCSDLTLEPELVPDHVLLETNDLGLFINDEVELDLEIVDKRGNPIENVPAWLDTTVIASNNIIRYEDGKLIAQNPGIGNVIVRVGEFSDNISVRVTPRLYVTQSTQNLNRNVPMVAGRDGVIRLFLNNEEKNVVENDISVEIYTNGTLSKTLQFVAQDLNLRPINDTFSATSLPISGQYIQPGMSIKIKTADGVSYPASPHPVNVIDVAEFHIRLVPIYVPSTGQTGDVNTQNMDEYMEALLDMFPVNDYKVDLHSPVTTSGDPDNTETQYDFYLNTLKNVRATWLAEGQPDYYYYGVIPQFGGGIVGLGYVSDLPGNFFARQAVGWDGRGKNIIPDAPGTLAHELGHNFGRQHTPCGDPDNPDPNYPYSGAIIGVYGYEVDQRDLKNPNVYKDLMSYCDPAWVSDYTYKALLDFRLQVNSTPNKVQLSQDVLLVWGSINKGKLSLEPAFRISAPPSLPKQSGPYALSGYDINGNQLFSISFAGVQVSRGNARHFAFAIPIEQVNINALQTIQLSGKSITANQRANVLPGNIQANKRAMLNNVSAQRLNSKTVRIQLKSSQYKMTLVKDADTGEVLGFTTGDVSEIKTNATALKLYVSDGVHTASKTISVQ